ncbi:MULTISPECIES: hypothetical protein [Kitasatospora]|uniref:Uncharacterized protein n=1 Tax=Kitasatospora setae (strain ATCC 33774 / DSM 43861 / JCM 3304 / KCC A-0304 / NBRC 14216 / KM-6054) TaxID=452652 RepID=E4NEZ1_KITSK|nr:MULTISPECIES: hypothetical protein [Kitasatospora]BAJ29927.1 hypothetical protein KSE_41410 [Kitasatospora setae KM-6054]
MSDLYGAGRHRGSSDDPIEAVVTFLWLLGNLVTVLVLGMTAFLQVGHGRLEPVVALSEPDREPAA